MASARVAPIRPTPPQQPERAASPIEFYHWLTCNASVDIPVPHFTVGDLLKLKMGIVLQTASQTTNDVPVYINKILLGRGQFEVVEKRLIVRITELA